MPAGAVTPSSFPGTPIDAPGNDDLRSLPRLKYIPIHLDGFPTKIIVRFVLPHREGRSRSSRLRGGMRWTPEMRRRAVQRGGPTPGRDTAKVPELHWRGGAVEIRTTTDPAHPATGERIARERPKSRWPRSSSWIIDGALRLAGHQGVSRSKSQTRRVRNAGCSGCPKVLAHHSCRLRLASGPRVHRAPGVPRALFTGRAGNAAYLGRRGRRENSKARLFDIRIEIRGGASGARPIAAGAVYPSPRVFAVGSRGRLPALGWPGEAGSGGGV